MNLDNRTIFIKDNLAVLRGIDSDSVDLIATDPPFNSGRDFHGKEGSLSEGAVLGDNWRWPRKEEGKEHDKYTGWLEEISDNGWAQVREVVEAAYHAHSTGLAAFLCFMAIRLIEMERVLKDTGSIYLHCDDTASHYLKALMDAVFGAERCMGEIVWERTKGDKGLGKNWARNNDRLLVYGPGRINKDAIRLAPTEKVLASYNRVDEHGRAWQSDNLTGRGGSPFKVWRGCVAPGNGGWLAPTALPSWFVKPAGFAQMSPEEKLDEYDRQGLIHWSKNGRPRFKRYLSTVKGQAPSNVWTDIPSLSSGASERKGVDWMTQKPVALYERIILASSQPGDLVLDPFCGCATTCIAAEKHGRQWVGIDTAAQAAKAVGERIKELPLLDGTVAPKPRIRFAAPRRTDGGEAAVADLPDKGPRPERTTFTSTKRQKEKARLLREHGNTCQGCGHAFPHEAYLEVDHITPKARLREWNADVGADMMHASSNLTLLCSPCNRRKGARLTLKELQEVNRKEGFGSVDGV